MAAPLPMLPSSGPVRLEVVRARPPVDRVSRRAVRSLLVSWAGAGAIVAAASAGYVGVTAAQFVSMATAEDPTVVVATESPALAASSVVPAPRAQAPGAQAPGAPVAGAPAASAPPATPSTPSAMASAPAAAPAEPDVEPDVEPDADPDAEPDAEPDGDDAAAPARKTAPDVQRSRQSERVRLEIKHARWADRQLAAMLRTLAPTSPVQQWFGGAAWTLPVAEYRLTAHFGASGRLWSSTHTGLDFAAPTGTPVRAATAGTVTSVGWAGAYGNRVVLTHPDGTETWYCHLSRTDVRVGAQVATGAVIAAVGATGNVTGSHLHFEVRTDDGSPLDPEKVLQEHGVRP